MATIGRWSTRHPWRAIAIAPTAITTNVSGDDATIVRAVLLPASMKLLRDWNSYLTAFLRRLQPAERDSPPARESV